MWYNINIEKNNAQEGNKMAKTNKMFIKRDNVAVMFKQVGELREAVVLENHGCTYTEHVTRFSSKEEGNKFYKMYIDAGYEKATEADYDRIVRGY